VRFQLHGKRQRASALPHAGRRRKPSGLLKITYIAEDFDAPDERIQALFEGRD
jgi:hypothetical protein